MDHTEVAVNALSLTIPDGELCILIGPSGCGKTTTLRMINRLIEPTGGRILIDDQNVLTMDPVILRRRRQRLEQRDPRRLVCERRDEALRGREQIPRGALQPLGELLGGPLDQ